MMILEMTAVVEVVFVQFDENLKILGDFGAGDDFLGVDLVESIDKRSIFRLDYSTYR